jgi:WD40 repeat protein
VGFNFGDMRWRAGVEMAVLGCGIVSRFVRFIWAGLMGCAVRTGQAHRTLIGHTAPVTCLQFDENYIISGGLDKTIRVGRLMRKTPDNG